MQSILRYNSFYMKPVVGVFAHPDDEVFVGQDKIPDKFIYYGRVE